MSKKCFWLVLFLGLLIRLLAWRLLPSALVDDGLAYQQLAINLLEKAKYFGREGVAFRPPLMPLFLAFIYFLGGIKTWLVSLILICFSILTVVLISQLTTKIFTKKAGDLALVLGAFCFDLGLFSPLLMGETLVIFLLVLGFCLFSNRRKNLAFFVWGLTLLGKPFLLIAYLLTFFVIKKLRISKVGLGNWGLIIFFLPAFFWSVRSTVFLKTPTFVSSNGGLNFYIAHNPLAKGTYDQETEQILNLYSDYPEGEKNKLYYQEGINYLLNHPLKSLVNIVKKPFYLMATFGGSAEGLIIREVKKESFAFIDFLRLFYGGGQLISYWLILFGTFYWFLTKKIINSWLKVFFAWEVGYLITLLALFTLPRFRIPLLPFLIIFASQGLLELVKSPRFKKVVLAISLLVLFTVRDWHKIVKWLL